MQNNDTALVYYCTNNEQCMKHKGTTDNSTICDWYKNQHSMLVNCLCVHYLRVRYMYIFTYKIIEQTEPNRVMH